jgi:hypothetical protein
MKRRRLLFAGITVLAALLLLGMGWIMGAGPSLAQPPSTEQEPAASQLPPGVDPFVLEVTAHKDTWVEEANPTANHGTDLDLTVGQVSRSVDVASILLGFDVSTLPPDAVVVSATLSLYSSDLVLGDPFLISPRAITAAWVENSVTWDTRPGTNSLGDPAAEHVNDGWTIFDVTNMVQAWNDGILSNNGIALQPYHSASGYRTYAASTTATPPTLTVYYTRRAVLEPFQDTWVGLAQPSTPHGADPSLAVTSPDNGEQEQNALLGFDVSGLPENWAVISATLSLYSVINLQSSAADTALVADLYADTILGSWNESTTWNSAPASAPLGDPPTSWVLNDYTRWDVTNIVQSWADGLEPYGILLRVGPESTHGYGFWSRETSGPPELVIDYGAAPPSCNPITSVDVNGATAGVTGVQYTFDVTLSPAGADPPDAVSWQVTDHPDRLYGESVTVSWSTPGAKELVVVVAHCGGTSWTVHTITITEPPSDCFVPIEGLGLSGPLVVDTTSPYVYHASSIPYNATDPVTFTWEATAQPPFVDTTSTNDSDETYVWNETGSKTISVTAENCGGSVVAYQNVEVVAPADLPDLVVDTAWNELDLDRIGFLVRNQGNTAVPAGFYMALEQGPLTPVVDAYPSPLQPGAIGVGFMDFAWTCTSMTQTVGVPADWSEVVVELDELNNRWSDTWTCDQEPPSIASGPQVVDITETRARVEWTSDEDCQSWVEYGTSPYSQPRTQAGPGTYQTSHAVGLTGLTASTTYYARAFCEDEAGYVVNSEPVQFETAPPGSDPPRVHTLTVEQYPVDFYEFWQLHVEMEDDTFMDRVTCSIDGVGLGTDYSADTSGAYPRYTFYLSPFELGLTRAQFFGHPHQFSCTAYRQSPSAVSTIQEDLDLPGDMAYPIRLFIDEPHPNLKIYADGIAVPSGTALDVVVYAAAHEWACTQYGFNEGSVVPPGLEPVDCDDQTSMAVDTIDLWLGGYLEATVSPGPSELVNTLTADLTGLMVGTHELRVVATKGSTANEDSQNLIVEQGEAGLEVERSIRREGHTLKVTLDLHNAGTATANVHRIVDNVIGLQPILERDTSTDPVHVVSIQEGEPLFDGSGALRKMVTIDFEAVALDLAPGESFSVNYVVMPVLLEGSRPPLVSTLWDPVDVWLYDTNANLYLEQFYLYGSLVDDPSYGMIPLEDAVAHAVALADYVIVTVPSRVYGLLAASGNDPDAELLFSNMAELASLKNGVLGYLTVYSYNDADVLDDLIEPDGHWTAALNPTFQDTDDGYVLIVGETEIVPSYYVGGDHFFTGPNIVEHTHYSDLWFANTRGETARPELVVGRVIGNGLTQLNTYLDNVIRAARGEPGYGFNRSRALLISGVGEGVSDFRDNVDHVAGQMEAELSDVNPLHWQIWDGDWNAAKLATQPRMRNNGMIFWNGHGNSDEWGDGACTCDFTGGFYDMGDTNPAVFAASCKTGNYEGGDDLGIAEAFLAAGAGAYIGSTESTEFESTTDAFRRLYSRWSADESMGQALNQMKRAIWDLDWGYDHRKLWAFTSNLYGDPKYGRLNAGAAQQDDPSVDGLLELTQEPQGAGIKLVLPELELYQVDGWDRAEIPGAGFLTEVDGYPVPVWITSVNYRPGTRVQDVQLVSRGTPLPYAGLNMPVVAGNPMGPADRQGLPQAAEAVSWYPEMDQILDWSVEDGPDGMTTLWIRIFPFFYHAATGDALYYRSYQLAVETVSTTAQIESLQAQQGSHEPGDPVSLTLVASRTGLPADLIVQPSVRTRGTNVVMGGLPLQTLHSFVGKAEVELLWNTNRYPAGDYQIVVELLDTGGSLLDTAVEEVRLGTHGAQVTSLTASSPTFSPGDAIWLTMGVANTGTVPISGTGVFLVQPTGSLSVTQVISFPVEGLLPRQTIRSSRVWDTTGARENSYRVLGYFKFRAQATEPMSLTLYRPRIFLPLVMRKQ